MSTNRLWKRTLGRHFSEGARLLWLAMQRLGLCQKDVSTALGVTDATVCRWLYGERRPGRDADGRDWSLKIQDTYNIPARLWGEPPAEPFVPPARAAVEAELAANPLPPPAA